jgi:uncharacterized protein YxjI
MSYPRVVIMLSTLLPMFDTMRTGAISNIHLSSEEARPRNKPSSPSPSRKTPTRLDKLRIGAKGKPLIPGMVFEKEVEWKVKDRRSFFAKNNYNWLLGNDTTPVAKLDGAFWSNALGRAWTDVCDASGAPLFVIRRNKGKFNPFQLLGRSFRLVTPDKPDEPLFTINNALTFRERFNIWEGRRGDGKLLYQSIGGFTVFAERKIYKISDGKEPDLAWIQQATPVAVMKQTNTLKSVAAEMIGAGDLFKDKYTLSVQKGEDSALLLALTTIVDMMIDRNR